MPIRVNIGDDQFDFFNSGTITLNYARATSSFRLSGLFDSQSEVYRRVFKPLDYKQVTIDTLRGERLITGVVTNHGFNHEARPRMASLFGYNNVGVLQDCSIPIGSPYQFVNLTLRQIAEQLASPFNVNVVVQNDNGLADETIDEETANITESIIQFLSRIASQKNLVLTSTPLGELLITRTIVDRPSIATYTEGLPGTKISLAVDGQNMHSDITAMQQADLDTNNVGQQTVNNSLVNSFRPRTIVQNTSDNNETELAARNIRANQLKNIRLTISSDRWEWLNNGLVETILPDNIVTVISPENYIFSATNFFVERVILTLDHRKETAILNCVLPQVYNNADPVNIFG